MLGFLGAAGALGRAALRSIRPRSRGAQWEAYHRAEGNGRRLYVPRGAELEPVGEVVSADPDYENRFLALMDRARERAAALNTEG